MATDVLAHLSKLDELIQILYHGFERFVVLSRIKDSAWTIHVGLQGPEGRWWRGAWSETDMIHFVGAKTNAQMLESLGEELSQTFVNGDVVIGDWNPERGAGINLTLGPTSKKPLHMPLAELSATEAASYATTILCEIALEAPKCRLFPPAFSPPQVQPALSRPSPARVEPGDTLGKAEQEIKALKAELARKADPGPSEDVASPMTFLLSGVMTEPRAAVGVHKGVSLANPHKKARKYQALEFGSDEE